jgi:DNA polymerase-3 subunit beta
MAQQDIRYYLNGLLLVVDGNSIIAVATDGHRLAYCQVATEQEFARQEVIIPRKTIIELQRLLEDTDEPVQINIANNQIKVNFADIELVSKLVEGKFPDFNRVVPKGYVNNVTLGREQLLRALQRAAIMTSDKFKGIRCVITPGSMRINSTNSDQEEAIEEIEIDYNGDSVDIGFNVTYLLEVLNNLKCDQINIALGDSTSSALITVPDQDDFKYVVMPMRI